MSTENQQTHLADLLEIAVHAHNPNADFRWKYMFGGAGYYVDEMIFAANYGEDELALKLPEEDRKILIAQGQFSPNSKQYVTLPPEVVEDPPQFAEWVAKSLAYVASLPKKSKSKKKK